MAQDVDGFKATAQEIMRSEMSDGAKLAALAELMGANGIECIATALNKSSRTVERHYAELRKLRKSADTQICGTTQNCVTELRKSADSDTQICVESSRAPASITTRATNELPSEVTTNEDNIITPLIAPPKPKVTRQAEPVACKPSASRFSFDCPMANDWRQWAAINFAHPPDATNTSASGTVRDYWI